MQQREPRLVADRIAEGGVALELQQGNVGDLVIPGRVGAVGQVTHTGMAQRAHVHPDLMGPAGLQPEPEEGHPRVARHDPLRDGFQRVRRAQENPVLAHPVEERDTRTDAWGVPAGGGA